jgi:hypothetical protein
MNSASSSWHLPTERAMPLALSLRARFARAGAAVWHALEASGRARALRHLLDYADQCESQQPELAKELRAAARHPWPHA